jgi:hypothetical protein
MDRVERPPRASAFAGWCPLLLRAAQARQDAGIDLVADLD